MIENIDEIVDYPVVNSSSPPIKTPLSRASSNTELSDFNSTANKKANKKKFKFKFVDKWMLMEFFYTLFNYFPFINKKYGG